MITRRSMFKVIGGFLAAIGLRRVTPTIPAKPVDQWEKSLITQIVRDGTTSQDEFLAAMANEFKKLKRERYKQIQREFWA